MGMNTVLHYTDATTNKPQNIVGSSGAAWSRPKYGTGKVGFSLKQSAAVTYARATNGFQFDLADDITQVWATLSSASAAAGANALCVVDATTAGVAGSWLADTTADGVTPVMYGTLPYNEKTLIQGEGAITFLDFDVDYASTEIILEGA